MVSNLEYNSWFLAYFPFRYLNMAKNSTRCRYMDRKKLHRNPGKSAKTSPYIAEVFSAYLVNLLRDSVRRGLMLWPTGPSSPPLPFFLVPWAAVNCEDTHKNDVVTRNAPSLEPENERFLFKGISIFQVPSKQFLLSRCKVLIVAGQKRK